MEESAKYESGKETYWALYIFPISSTFSSMTFSAAKRILRVIGCQSILNSYQFKAIFEQVKLYICLK